MELRSDLRVSPAGGDHPRQAHDVLRSALLHRQWLWGEFGHLGDHGAVGTAEEAKRRAEDWVLRSKGLALSL